MKETIPSAFPRGPKRRTQTAPKSTTMKPTSAILPNWERNAAKDTAPTAGKNSRSIVITRLRCCLSLTAADACMATMVPSIATVIGWCATRVKASSETMATTRANVVAEALRRRNRPGSESTRNRRAAPLAAASSIARLCVIEL